ncbi:MAG: PmoA family protein [Bacteroidales bacterium]|nr:PmoA family protein [Bacteroidales bacterium]
MHIFKTLFFAIVVMLLTGCSKSPGNGRIKVLILSGKNNHEWQKTTPLLAKIYSDSKLFSVAITELPDTLKYDDLKQFDVVVSNWNSWPDNNFRFPQTWEKDFMKYINKGGGAIFIHAGASSFYGWNEYHKIGIGRWGKETNHGAQTKGRISDFDQNHPVTKGLKDFYIIDEIWEKTDIYPGSTALASVTATDLKDGHNISEKAVFVSQTGEGRSFFTTLGHNERALLNSGLQVLLLRAAQWAAQRDVTTEPPAEMMSAKPSRNNNLNWSESDTTLLLKNDSDLIWQFNYNNRFGKPYFHPLCVKNSILTCASPPDHPWHLGYWFCWKFINGVNYWEFLDNFKSEETGYKSAGITQIIKHEFTKNPDFSADIRLQLTYHPADSAALLDETCNIHISPPFADGSYFIDNEHVFTSLADNLVLDRTPVQKEPGGRSWGGYAGLSIRFSQDFTSPIVIAPDEQENYKKNNWVYMGFNTLTGETAGVCIIQNLKFTTPSTSWYVINNPEIPFFYYSPAVIYDGKIILKKGETLHLKYRTWIIAGKQGLEDLQLKYDDYLKN